jgi:hypothetical protein
MIPYCSSETGEVCTAYGVIQRMFLHKFWPADDAPEKVVAVADWYEVVGINPVNRLPLVKLQPHFNSCSLVFLEDCVPANCKLLPTDPFVAQSPTSTFDVIMH